MPTESENERESSLLEFLKFLRGAKVVDELRPFLRITPKGIFVDSRCANSIVEVFQNWRYQLTNGAADKSIEKTGQWLFQSATPEKFYLVEGRNSLIGSLIPVEITAPQGYGISYYLGSLLPASGYLHEADPDIQDIQGLTARRKNTGLEFELSLRAGPVIFSEKIVRTFSEIAHSSRFLQRKYPGSESNLVTALKGLVSIIRRARAVPKTIPMVVPYSIKKGRSKGVLLSGKFLFLHEDKTIIDIIELNGRHLSTFLKQELSRAPKEKLHSFRLTPKQRDILGFFSVGTVRTSVHARAFSDFVELIHRSRDPREKFSGWFTALECFEVFATKFQTAQPIEKKKIAMTLNQLRIEGASFRISDGWIFALSRDKSVLRVGARHIRQKTGSVRRPNDKNRLDQHGNTKNS
jgi:hypothetical protein